MRRKKKTSRPTPPPTTRTLAKGVWIMEQWEKGYSFTKIGKSLGITRQRVYQIVKDCGFKDVIRKIYQQRIIKRLDTKLKILKCTRCGDEYVPNRLWRSRLYCGKICRTKAFRERDRIRLRNYFRNNPEARIKAIARDRIRRERKKQKLDIKEPVV